jgi:predicted NUDIX family NTP pyrophosphohydrolase
VTKRSAGILLYRHVDGVLQVLLGHSGGPFFARKDLGAWSIPKGEYGPAEPAIDAARREFTEELGLPVPAGQLHELGDVALKSGKVLTVWALAAELDPASIVPGTFELEWPPRSGTVQNFPEIDRVAWFGIDDARAALFAGQPAFLDRLINLLASAAAD